MQMSSTPSDASAAQRMSAYVEKTHRKTASLFASSCRSAAILAGEQERAKMEIDDIWKINLEKRKKSSKIKKKIFGQSNIGG